MPAGGSCGGSRAAGGRARGGERWCAGTTGTAWSSAAGPGRMRRSVHGPVRHTHVGLGGRGRWWEEGLTSCRWCYQKGVAGFLGRRQRSFLRCVAGTAVVPPHPTGRPPVDAPAGAPRRRATSILARVAESPRDETQRGDTVPRRVAESPRDETRWVGPRIGALDGQRSSANSSRGDSAMQWWRTRSAGFRHVEIRRRARTVTPGSGNRHVEIRRRTWQGDVQGSAALLLRRTRTAPHPAPAPHTASAPRRVPGERACDQNPRRAPTSASSEPIGTRTCWVVSRSRIVTAPSSRESKSTVTHKGVPISSWRRYRRPMACVSS